ncbi:MAG: hypothetical protein HY835_05120 [Anaerolineae bacterium]|nr:hypothetical protein [Anaerolineae bacterium]
MSVQGRAEQFAYTLPDGKVFLLGGRTQIGQFADSTLIFNPDSEFNWGPGFPMKNDHIAAVSIQLRDGKILIAGGHRQDGTVIKSAEVFDPSTNRWQSIASMKTARQFASIASLDDGRILVMGGNDGVDTLTSAEIYNPETNQWTLTSSMTVPRENFSAISIPLSGGKVLVAGGWMPGLTDTAEVFDPASETWTFTVNRMSLGRLGFKLEALPDGRVLAIGGWSDSIATDSVDLFDPATKSWSPAGNLLTPRFAYASAALPDGHVIIVGGDSYATTDGQDTLATAELFDPQTLEWRELPGSLQAPRRDLTLFILKDGRLLVTGGTDDGGNVYDLVDIYTPGNR